jgi:ribosomal protein L11 methylase PrmA
MDYDPVAAGCAKENLEANGIAGVDVQAADIERWPDTRTFGVVAANMESVRLIRYAEAVARRVSGAPGSVLILAGALTGQYAGVVAAYEAQGLRERDRAESPPWVSAVFTRPLRGTAAC